jgi:galactose mutarotase-like enzyme
VLQGVWLEGAERNLTLGSDRLSDYEGAMRYHGSLIGPVVNRFTDARAPLGGRVLRFDANQDNRHCLHSGSAGTHLKVWRLAEATEDSLRLELDLPDGQGGFPGNRRVTAAYQVDGVSLHLRVHVTTDQPTLVNFANHSYWNLDGAPTWAGHRLWVDAPYFLPTTPDFTPTGEMRPVEEGGMDFRKTRRIDPATNAFDTTSFITYCIELEESFSFSSTAMTGYSLVDGASYFAARRLANPLRPDGAQVAERLGRLFTWVQADATRVDTAAESTALQLAVWNIVYDADWSLFNAAGRYSDSSSHAVLANIMMANAAFTPNQMQVYALTRSGRQDFLVTTLRVPSPGTLALVGLGLAAAALALRRGGRRA